MNLSQYAELDGVTVGSSELSVISGTTALATDTTQGWFWLILDVAGATLAKDDRYVVRYYEKVEATGGTKKVIFTQTIYGPYTENILFPGVLFKNGWDITIQKLAGADRAFDARIYGVQTTIDEPYELDGVSVDNTFISIPSGTTTPSNITSTGLYQFLFDPANMVKGDEFEFRVYEKAEVTGGTQRLLYSFRIDDVSAQQFSPIIPLFGGWDVGLIRIAGSARTFDASVRRLNVATASEKFHGSAFNRGLN